MGPLVRSATKANTQLQVSLVAGIAPVVRYAIGVLSLPVRAFGQVLVDGLATLLGFQAAGWREESVIASPAKVGVVCMSLIRCICECASVRAVSRSAEGSAEQNGGLPTPDQPEAIPAQ